MFYVSGLYSKVAKICLYCFFKKIIFRQNEKSTSIYFRRLEDNGAEGKV